MTHGQKNIRIWNLYVSIGA